MPLDPEEQWLKDLYGPDWRQERKYFLRKYINEHLQFYEFEGFPKVERKEDRAGMVIERSSTEPGDHGVLL